MCGRYSLTSPVEAMRHLFGLEVSTNLAPRYNIAPSQEVPVVRLDAAGDRTWELLRWGLVPSWAKDPAIGNKMINARSETVAEKPSFRSAFKRRRCLIPADGFYEWKREGGRKQPYRICLDDGAPFAFAGLWEHWSGSGGGGEIESCTILTAEAEPAIRAIHHRMPVILAAEAYGAWLDVSQAVALGDLARLDEAALSFYPVSTHVNRPANDDARCLEEAAPVTSDRNQSDDEKQDSLF